MRHVVETMGTVASIELPASAAGVLPAIERDFERIEQRFSRYRDDSEVSLVALDLLDASPELLATYARALDWRSATNGLFTPHRPDGALDLDGIVKAEAIEAAGGLLDAAGCQHWSINVGGDILVRTADEPWITGIADPADRSALLCSIPLSARRRAIATSGSTERGDHIWLGGRLRPADFVQVSVVADDIVTADVLATAIVAGGPDALVDLTDRFDIDVLTVDRAGSLSATPGFRRALEGSLHAAR
ncbi:thiamine biosynthesis lipoprotein [Leifsonia sp. AK011]|uniref:FAD:protein FMN transferase n=1 Tax=Leifsonia sp. AK011 TaxID=2723075 RepID=UPI0017D9D9F1|nr:FAD:protein FMN transferase [Leifsonia sp. AK011]NYF09080.1 thiamine biosynthesis lipoprotein [Leifsonia sp. AK011]